MIGSKNKGIQKIRGFNPVQQIRGFKKKNLSNFTYFAIEF
jgi:hypothetical protein